MLRNWLERIVGTRPLTPTEQALAWFDDKSVFFLLGMGRSGTNFLADMLSHCPVTLVHHEPVTEDFDAFVEAHSSEARALSYIENFRVAQMYHLAKAHDIRCYGEVNSALRFHGKALKAVLPKAKLLHLVRDGRDVVRSIMERKHYMPEATSHHNLAPLPTDPLYAKWNSLSRFEKVCWLWADANRRVAQDVPDWIAFEPLVSDYRYFRGRLLEPVGLEMDEATWNKLVSSPTNVTKKFSFPKWQDWGASQRAMFDAICGEQMARFGYS